MKTLGDVAVAMQRMETLTRKLTEGEEQLLRAMFPEERAALQEKIGKWSAEYAALMATPLLETVAAAPAQGQRK